MAINKYWQNLKLAIGNYKSHYIIYTFHPVAFREVCTQWELHKWMLPRSEINVGKLFCTSDKSSLKCYRMYMFFSRPGSMRAGIRAGTVQVLGHSQKYAIQIITLPLQISVPLPRKEASSALHSICTVVSIRYCTIDRCYFGSKVANFQNTQPNFWLIQ